MHALELQLVAQREEVQSLSTVVEEQGHFLNSQQQYNVQLLEVVRTQQELLTANNIPNTPRLDTLYQLVCFLITFLICLWPGSSLDLKIRSGNKF